MTKKYECNECWDSPCECIVPNVKFLVEICPNDPEKATKCNWKEVEDFQQDYVFKLGEHELHEGDWIYYRNHGLAQIKNISPGVLHVQDGNGDYSIYFDDDRDKNLNNLKLARRRCWNEEELRQTVGRVFNIPNSGTAFVHSFTSGCVHLLCGERFYQYRAEELMEMGATLSDGSPCCVLEIVEDEK